MKENDITDGENKPEFQIVDLIVAAYGAGLDYGLGLENSKNIQDYINSLDIKQFIKR